MKKAILATLLAVCIAVSVAWQQSRHQMVSVPNIAALATTQVADGALVQTLSHTSGGIGGNTFFYDRSSSATANGSTIVNGPGSVGRFIVLNQREANVLQFGAIGDGIADDTAAIQAAIDAMQTTGGQVFFPKGIYEINSELTLYNDISLIGEQSTIAASATFASTRLASANNRTGVHISGITFDGTAGGNIAGIIIFTAASDWIVEDCKFIGLGSTSIAHGIRFDVPENVIVRNCLFDTSYRSLEFRNGVGKITVENCRFANVAANAIYLSVTNGTTLTDGVLITGNYASDAAGNGSPYYVTGGRTVPSDGFGFTNIVISDNVAIGSDTAFGSGGSADLFSLKDMFDFTLSGNIARSGGDLGFAIERSERGSVTGNHAEDNNTSGIAIFQSSHIAVSGNSCLNNTQDRDTELMPWDLPYAGIIVIATGGFPCDSISVVGNTCSDDQVSPTQAYGVALRHITDDITNLIIGQNTCSGNLFGPYWSDATDGEVYLHNATASEVPTLGIFQEGDSVVVNGIRYHAYTANGVRGAVAKDGDWQATTAYNVGDVVRTPIAGDVWYCETAGTSDSSEPATASTATDGTVFWRLTDDSECVWLRGSNPNVAIATDQDATPDVTGIDVLHVLNAGVTEILDFDGTLYDGQRLTLIVEDVLTIIDGQGTNTIVTTSGTDIPVGAGRYEFIYDASGSGIWYELGTSRHKPLNFAPQDATPSVLNLRVGYTTSTTATVITDFDDGYDGQIVTIVIVGLNDDIDADSAFIETNSGVDITDPGEYTFLYDLDNDVWRELD